MTSNFSNFPCVLTIQPGSSLRAEITSLDRRGFRLLNINRENHKDSIGRRKIGAKGEQGKRRPNVLVLTEYESEEECPQAWLFPCGKSHRRSRFRFSGSVSTRLTSKRKQRRKAPEGRHLGFASSIRRTCKPKAQEFLFPLIHLTFCWASFLMVLISFCTRTPYGLLLRPSLLHGKLRMFLEDVQNATLSPILQAVAAGHPS